MSLAPGETAHPALALANSRRNEPAGPVDDLATAGALSAWLARHGLGDRIRADAAEARALRAAVRELLLARIEVRVPDRDALAAVNAAAAAAPTAPRLVWTERGAPRAERELHDGGFAAAAALLAADAIELVTGPSHADLRACAAPGCLRLLLRDHPRRQWCSTRCGDRVRASRYYHRHRLS